VIGHSNLQIMKTKYEKDEAIITVIIPTFNRAKLLLRAINSVKRQSYQNWRLIISDNASTDETPSVVADAMRIDSRINYLRHPENIGMLPNWAFAISKVETPFFCILCDDDILLPEFFQTTIDTMLERNKIGLCFGTTAIVDDNGFYLGPAPKEMSFGYYPAGYGASAMIKSQHPASTGTLFRTSCVEAVGGFDQHSHYVADLDMMLRVALMYPIVYVDKEVAFYIVHDKKSFKDNSFWFPGIINVLRNIKRFEIDDPSEKLLILKRLTNNAVLPLIIHFIGHPLSSYKSINFTMIFKYLQEAWPTKRMILYYLFTCVIQTGALLYKNKRLFLSHFLKFKDKNKMYLCRHPNADEYF